MYIKHHLIWVLNSLVLILSIMTSQAATVEISAEFKPSAAEPDKNSFTDTTAHSGFCKTYPTACPAGTFSIMTDLSVENKTLSHSSRDNRDHTYQKANSRWQYVMLTDHETGKSIVVQFRIVLLAQRFARTSNSFNGSDFNLAGRAPEGGCTGTTAYMTSQNYEFAWLHPAEISTCYKTVKNIDYNDVKIERISVGYEMKSLSPLTMPNGSFKGGYGYTVGKGMDIDFGEGTYSDDTLQVNISAEIQHDFKVSIQGSNSVELSPPGGWRSWSASNNAQFRLEGTGQVNMTASSPVSITAYCTHEQLKSCALKREGGDETVAVDIDFSMPGMHERESKEPVTRIAIPITTPTTPGLILVPDSYVNGAIGQVNFSVNEIESLKMAKHLGSTWKGSATLVFDADLPFSPDAAGGRK